MYVIITISAGCLHTHIRGGTVSAADLPVWISQLMNVRLPRSGL